MILSDGRVFFCLLLRRLNIVTSCHSLPSTSVALTFWPSINWWCLGLLGPWASICFQDTWASSMLKAFKKAFNIENAQRPKKPVIPQRHGRPKRPHYTESQLIRCYHHKSLIPTEIFRSNHLKRRPIKGISSFVKCVKIVLLQLQNCANIEKDITNLGFICAKCDNSATP